MVRARPPPPTFRVSSAAFRATAPAGTTLPFDQTCALCCRMAALPERSTRLNRYPRSMSQWASAQAVGRQRSMAESRGCRKPENQGALRRRPVPRSIQVERRGPRVIHFARSMPILPHTVQSSFSPGCVARRRTTAHSGQSMLDGKLVRNLVVWLLWRRPLREDLPQAATCSREALTRARYLGKRAIFSGR